MCRSCKILVHRGLGHKVWSSRHGILLPANGGLVRFCYHLFYCSWWGRECLDCFFCDTFYKFLIHQYRSSLSAGAQAFHLRDTRTKIKHQKLTGMESESSPFEHSARMVQSHLAGQEDYGSSEKLSEAPLWKRKTVQGVHLLHKSTATAYHHFQRWRRNDGW